MESIKTTIEITGYKLASEDEKDDQIDELIRQLETEREEAMVFLGGEAP